MSRDDDTPRWMATTATLSALVQLERDLVLLNSRDLDDIESIRRRIKGRSRLLKRLRRFWRNRGLVNVSWDSANPSYMRRKDIEARDG